MNTNTPILFAGIILLITAILFWRFNLRILLLLIPKSRLLQIERAEDTLALIDELRESEGSSVLISSDNGEPETHSERCCIGVIDDWTSFETRNFYGESVIECLRAAVRAKGETANIGRTVKL